MPNGTVRVSGYRETMRALSKAEKASRKVVRDRLKLVAEPVRAEAQTLFGRVDARSAAGYRVAVRARGVAVEQRLARTTGLHPSFGSKQMREALMPALDSKADDIEHGLEQALDDIADFFEKG